MTNEKHSFVSKCKRYLRPIFFYFMEGVKYWIIVNVLPRSLSLNLRLSRFLIGERSNLRRLPLYSERSSDPDVLDNFRVKDPSGALQKKIFKSCLIVKLPGEAIYSRALDSLVIHVNPRWGTQVLPHDLVCTSDPLVLRTLVGLENGKQNYQNVPVDQIVFIAPSVFCSANGLTSSNPDALDSEIRNKLEKYIGHYANEVLVCCCEHESKLANMQVGSGLAAIVTFINLGTHSISVYGWDQYIDNNDQIFRNHIIELFFHAPSKEYLNISRFMTSIFNMVCCNKLLLLEHQRELSFHGRLPDLVSKYNRSAQFTQVEKLFFK